MLNSISPFIGPDLLALLCRMGHGDEIVLADANFPGHSTHERTLRADGITVAQLLSGILPLFPLDAYVSCPLAMMRVVRGDSADPAVEREYRRELSRHQPQFKKIERVERFAFYERSRRAYAVVMTGESRKYANLILKKGVVTASAASA